MAASYILCLNSGSSSLKFHLFAFDTLKALAWGTLDHGSTLSAKLSSCTPNGAPNTTTLEEKDLDGAKGPAEAANFIIRGLVDPKSAWGVADRVQLDAIGVVCHRVVHGGEQYVQPTRLDKKMLDRLEHLSDLAPLHNPASVATIRGATSLLPRAEHVALFDTAFHASLPPHAFLYPLDYAHYEKHRIRKYGFHGLSHQFISHAAAEALGRPYDKCKLITLHLGGGCSAAAIAHGVSVDTSMGMTPVEGLMMATRSGDVDPGVVLRLVTLSGGDAHKVERELNSHSGALGIAGTGDFRRLLSDAKAGEPKASLALRMFVQRVSKVVGAYWVVLGGADAVVFSGGIGEHAAEVRRLVARDLDCLGAELDEAANARHSTVISAPGSRVAMLVIATNEELEMARQAQQLLSGQAKA